MEGLGCVAKESQQSWAIDEDGGLYNGLALILLALFHPGLWGR